MIIEKTRFVKNMIKYINKMQKGEFKVVINIYKIGGGFYNV